MTLVLHAHTHTHTHTYVTHVPHPPTHICCIYTTHIPTPTHPPTPHPTQDRLRLLQLLLSMEADRMQVWATPEHSQQQFQVQAYQQHWTQLISTAWDVHPQVALNLGVGCWEWVVGRGRAIGVWYKGVGAMC